MDAWKISFSFERNCSPGPNMLHSLVPFLSQRPEKETGIYNIRYSKILDQDTVGQTGISSCVSPKSNRARSQPKQTLFWKFEIAIFATLTRTYKSHEHLQGQKTIQLVRRSKSILFVRIWWHGPWMLILLCRYLFLTSRRLPISSWCFEQGAKHPQDVQGNKVTARGWISQRRLAEIKRSAN